MGMCERTITHSLSRENTRSLFLVGAFGLGRSRERARRCQAAYSPQTSDVLSPLTLAPNSRYRPSTSICYAAAN